MNVSNALKTVTENASARKSIVKSVRGLARIGELFAYSRKTNPDCICGVNRSFDAKTNILHQKKNSSDGTMLCSKTSD